MCELLVRVRDREGHNTKLNGEGHVVCVCPDGWGWSRLERSNPDWRILAVPDMTENEARALLSRQRVLSEFFEPARRAFYLDADRWSTDVREWWLDDSRSRPTMTVAKAIVEAAKAEEPTYGLANVIGAPPVLG